MDQVVAFMKEFLTRDFEARRAVFAEPDETAFEEKVRAVDRFFDPSAGGSGLGRPPGFGTESTDPLSTAAQRQTLARIRPRILFLIRQYRHVVGDLFRCYVDQGEVTRNSSYFESVFVAGDAKGMGIIARWGICLNCLGAGHADAQACHACGGSGWEPAGGKSLGELGPVIEVRRLQAPTDPVSLADYEKD